jgi:dynein heavy chain
LAEKDGIDYRKDFSNWWKSAWTKKSAVKFPSKGTIFDYFVDQAGESSKFSEWSTRLIPMDFDPASGLMSNITVPTIENVATSDFIKNYIFSKHQCLLIGNAGSGKT